MIYNKIKNISLFFSARSDHCPDMLSPSHAGIDPDSFFCPPVNYGMSSFSFSSIIGRFEIRVCQKTEIGFRRLALKSPSQFFGQFMIRRLSSFFQKTSLNLLHTFFKLGFAQFITAMHGIKQISKSIQQFLAPVRELAVGMFGKETDLADKMSLAILNGRIAELGKLTIGFPEVTAAKQIEQSFAASGFVYMKHRILRSLKTTRPVFIAIVFMAGLIYSKIRILRHTFNDLLIGRFKRSRYFLNCFVEHTTRNIKLLNFFEKLLNGRKRPMQFLIVISRRASLGHMNLFK